ncbi:MAG: YaaA family protein [Tenericutes bacterium]|nr:YaaA family protein [Mycoplasmatota bacterium]
MKIIISPSKTMEMQKSNYLSDKELLFPKEHKKILASLRKLSKKELSQALAIKGNLLEQTYGDLLNYSKASESHAFPSYTGLVYKNLDKENYHQDEYNYLINNLRILDAFYGVLEPGTLIKPYRLDMKAKIALKLYLHWNVSDYFKEELIINLASSEFSTMLNLEMINISFLEKKNNKFVNQATYSKMARGKFLDYLIKNKIENLEKMKSFKEDNYCFNQELSDSLNLVFTR